jgi:hypothetical protein
MPREALLGNRRWDLLPRLAGDDSQPTTTPVIAAIG